MVATPPPIQAPRDRDGHVVLRGSGRGGRVEADCRDEACDTSSTSPRLHATSAGRTRFGRMEKARPWTSARPSAVVGGLGDSLLRQHGKAEALDRRKVAPHVRHVPPPGRDGQPPGV